MRSLTKNLSQAIGGDARELLTADIVINSTGPFTPTILSNIEKAAQNSGIVEARGGVTEVTINARPTDDSNETIGVISLKGIESNFPLVGHFSLSSKKPFDYKILQNNGAVIASDLLKKLNLKIGDKIRIGEADFEVRETFSEEPGRAGSFFGNRVFIENSAFDKAEITKNRSRVRRRILFRTSSDPTPLVKELRKIFKGTTITVQSYRETQEDLGEQFQRTEDYLSLTGLLILVLGGVGVWNVARAFVEQKRKSIAVLKCLGASGNRVISVYLLQILTLGLIGSFFGIVLAQIGLWFIGYRFADDLPRTMVYGVHSSVVWQGITLGILISLLFSALPLLHVRTIKPRLLLHDDTGEKLKKLDWTKWGIGVFCLSGLIALATWQAGSITVGAYFLVGLSVTAAVLYISASLLMWLLKKVRNLGTFSLTQAVNSLHRPGNQTRVILLAVGLGAFVILSVQSLEENLIRVFNFSRNQNFPSMFFIDVQKSQVDKFRKLVKENTGEAPETIPTIRARIASVKGEPFDFNDREIRRRQGQIGREFAVTYRNDLDENESIVAGKWWGKDADSKEHEISLNQNWSRRLDVKVGDTITFDISGRKITSKITNIRKIDFSNSRTAFAFVFRPGTLEKAPHSYIATVLKKQDEQVRVHLKREILERFPNVQIFDILDIAVLIQKLVNNFVLAISFVGGFVILTGMLILIGAIALTKSQRVYDNAILKTLGANRKTLALILFAEYGILGLMAGFIGSVFAMILSYSMSEYVLKIEWEFNPGLLALGILSTTVLVMLVGAISSFDVIFRKPLSILRSQ